MKPGLKKITTFVYGAHRLNFAFGWLARSLGAIEDFTSSPEQVFQERVAVGTRFFLPGERVTLGQQYSLIANRVCEAMLAGERLEDVTDAMLNGHLEDLAAAYIGLAEIMEQLNYQGVPPTSLREKSEELLRACR